MRLLIKAQFLQTELREDAPVWRLMPARRAQPVRERAWELADWTILLTDVPANLLNLQEALVLVRERWQMEMLYKVWKQYGQIDEWRTANPWRGRMSNWMPS